LELNLENDQNKKAENNPELNRLKYDALHVHSRISLRFKPDDGDANVLLDKLLGLLDPSKLNQNCQYSSWRDLSDEAVLRARVLLKEEWETTKNPLRGVYKVMLKWRN